MISLARVTVPVGTVMELLSVLLVLVNAICSLRYVLVRRIEVNRAGGLIPMFVIF